MNIKFPKEQIRVVEEIRNSVIKKSKSLLQEQYDNILLHSKFLEQYYSSLLEGIIAFGCTFANLISTISFIRSTIFSAFRI